VNIRVALVVNPQPEESDPEPVTNDEKTGDCVPTAVDKTLASLKRPAGPGDTYDDVSPAVNGALRLHPPGGSQYERNGSDASGPCRGFLMPNVLREDGLVAVVVVGGSRSGRNSLQPVFAEIRARKPKKCKVGVVQSPKSPRNG
jgi:hypothetical protein